MMHSSHAEPPETWTAADVRERLPLVPMARLIPVLNTKRHPRARLIRRLIIWQRTNTTTNRQQVKP